VQRAGHNCCTSTRQPTLVPAPAHTLRSPNAPAPQVMGKSKVLVKVHPEGKYVVDLDKSIDVGSLTPGARRVC